jgi:hypothetical protein
LKTRIPREANVGCDDVNNSSFEKLRFYSSAAAYFLMSYYPFQLAIFPFSNLSEVIFEISNNFDPHINYKAIHKTMQTIFVTIRGRYDLKKHC